MPHHDTSHSDVESTVGTAADGEEPAGMRRVLEHISTLDALRIAAVAVATGLIGFGLVEGPPTTYLVGGAALVFGVWPIVTEAIESLVERRMTMELSMTIAIVAAALIGEVFTALIITAFVLVAEILEEMTVERGRRAIGELLDLLPRTVTVRRQEGTRTISVEELHAGEIILVEPGSRIPVDGTVTAGESFVDQANVTGESMPVEKTTGEPVYAGTVNLAGALEVGVERIGRDTTYGRIIESVERAEGSKAPVQRLSDQVAGYLVYFALSAAAVTYLITRDVTATIAVIIVAGACGVAAGTPLAILGAIGRAARDGVIIKGGVHVEALSKVDTVVLDKTGTLTFGSLHVQDVIAAEGHDPSQVLHVAATAEIRSEHPLGKAIVAHARNHGIEPVEPESFRYAPGQGITATSEATVIVVGNTTLMRHHQITIPDHFRARLAVGASHVLVARGGTLLGAVAVADTIRPEARHAVDTLRRLGTRVVLLTGDNPGAATAVGASLGITEVEAGLLPDEKLQRIESLLAGGATVAMIGDGINDSPALVAADVGVAMGSGTDIAHESGDIILLGNDLTRFADTLTLARTTRRIVFQNLGGTIAIDLVGIALASAGLLAPVAAAFVHVTSELAFLLNSARLLPRRNRSTP